MQKAPVKAWQQLETTLFGPVYKEVWDRFDEQFHFRAGIPGIDEPVPSVTYSLRTAFASNSNEDFDARCDETNRKLLVAFRACTQEQDRLYALDRHHEAFWFYPHGTFEECNLNGWKIPVFPDGDYYIFIAEDFNFGTFGHPWEQTICIFGQQLVDAVESDKPDFFEEIRRKK